MNIDMFTQKETGTCTCLHGKRQEHSDGKRQTEMCACDHKMR